MATNYGNIDEFLTSGGNSLTPETPESKTDLYGAEDDETANISEPEEPEGQQDFADKIYIDPNEDERDEKEEAAHDEKEFDDYGNEKASAKTYTEEEVNERINKAVRERLARGQQQEVQQPTQPQGQAQSGFEYNPDSQETWEQQLERFVEHTVSRMGEKQSRAQSEARERQIQSEFETKFTQGMDRFADFRDVVSAQPVTDAMTIALRGINDPSAFIYAASKRHPQELQRIANLPDQYSQMVEMGKLEERMRKSPATTKVPRPVKRTTEDAQMKVSDGKKVQASIEDLIKQSENKKMAKLKQRWGK